MGDNMRKHMNSSEGQSLWKEAKYERAFEETQETNKKLSELNDQLLEQMQATQAQSEARLRIMYIAIEMLGGSIEIMDGAMGGCEGKILASVDEEKGSTTFYIERSNEPSQ